MYTHAVLELCEGEADEVAGHDITDWLSILELHASDGGNCMEIISHSVDYW